VKIKLSLRRSEANKKHQGINLKRLIIGSSADIDFSGRHGYAIDTIREELGNVFLLHCRKDHHLLTGLQ
jgi:hypothetical protein